MQDECYFCQSGEDLKKKVIRSEGEKINIYICDNCLTRKRIELKCSKCSSNICDFERSGLLGCSKCYDDLSIFISGIVDSYQEL